MFEVGSIVELQNGFPSHDPVNSYEFQLERS
jgi:hypothetical protein